VPDSSHAITDLLRAWSGGNERALDRLLPALYEELHRTARARMRHERAGHTLQPTALVNEAFMRMLDAREIDWQDRAHFFAVASRMMRRILVDHARSRRYAKRGGGAQLVSLENSALAAAKQPADLIALEDALGALEQFDARKARVVELRFFGGLSVEEAAAALNVSPQTVLRDWRLSKSWLAREMSKDQHG